MFITCQECNTTFRLDERLLKPTGSKVRCSQCRYKFIAMPPRAKPTEALIQMPLNVASESRQSVPTNSEPFEEKELEGIDLAELDSILVGTRIDAQQVKQVEDSEGESADLDEMDLDFDFDAALETHAGETQTKPAVGEKEPEEINLDMDFEIDDGISIPHSTAEMSAPSKIEEGKSKSSPQKEISGEPTLGDDLETALQELELEPEEAIAPVANRASDKAEKKDGLGLDDFDLDLEGPAPGGESDVEDIELSLDENIDKGVENSVSTEQSAKEPVAITSKDDLGLDLNLDLDLDLEDEELESALGEEETELSLDAELGLKDDFELEAESTPDLISVAEKGQRGGTAAKKDESIDDLDLSDLDTLMGSGGDESDTAAELLKDQDFQLPDDLDLEPDEDRSKSGKFALEEGAEEELEDLDFELDVDFEGKNVAQAIQSEEEPGSISEEDEIDLSDIEEMLGGDTDKAPTAPPVEISQEESDLAGEGEIDLGEIESAIDEADKMPAAEAEVQDEQELELDLSFQEPGAEKVAPDDLRLDLSMEPTAAKDEDGELDLELELEGEAQSAAGETVDLDKDELDFSDLSDLVEEQTPVVKADTISSGDIELDFQIEENAEAAPSSTSAGVARTTGKVAEIPIEQTIETMAIEEAVSAKPKPFKTKKKTSKSLVVLFFLILIGAIGYGVYYAVMQLGIEIPYVSDYLKPIAKDPSGILNLSTLDINSKFIDNSQSGRLFVITGKVHNGYNAQRSNIRLQGRLFTKGKVLVKTEFSYAGIMIDDQDLVNLPIAEIKQRLNAVPQPQEGAGSARPGQNIPFMVVFSELPPPDQLDEFAVELVSSTPSP